MLRYNILLVRVVIDSIKDVVSGSAAVLTGGGLNNIQLKDFKRMVQACSLVHTKGPCQG